MDTATEASPQVARPRWRTPALVGLGVTAGCAAVVAVDPTDTGVPICWSQAVFGIDCPLCGGLRCTNALLRGDVSAALDHNVLLAVALPLIAVAWVVWLVRSLRDEPFRLPRFPTWLLTAFALVVVAFTIARNLDAGGWIGWLGSTA